MKGIPQTYTQQNLHAAQSCNRSSLFLLLASLHSAPQLWNASIETFAPTQVY